MKGPRDSQQSSNGANVRDVENIQQHGSDSGVAEDEDNVVDHNIELEIDTGDLSCLDASGRNLLFQRGLVHEQNQQSEAALKCYLGCLSGLTQSTSFPLLPQCLRSIADIYYKKEDFQRAIQFIQAEKLFYENALIDISELQKQIEKQDEEGLSNGGGDGTTVDEVRAEEYEQLAKLCLQKTQPHLALEYAGKATKIRQALHGDNHPSTLQSLDFFASVYAEVGKQQYSDSLGQLSSDTSPERSDGSPCISSPAGQERADSGEGTPTSILRNRKGDHNGVRRKSAQHVRFQDQDDTTEGTDDIRREHEERVSNKLLVSLFLICSVLLSLLGLLLYCRLVTDASSSCLLLKSYVHYAYMKLKYYYYHFSSTKLLKYV